MRWALTFTLLTTTTTACFLLIDSSDYSGGDRDAAVAETGTVHDGGPVEGPGDASSDIVTAPTHPYVAAVLEDKPTGYFRFEESAGLSCANEIAGSSISCLYPSSNVTYGAPGAVGRCVRFDEFSVRTMLTGPTDFPNDVPFTIEVWALVESVGTERQIFSQMKDPGNTTTRTGTWFLFNDTSIFTETWVNGVHYLYTGFSSPLPMNRFVHLALVHSDRDYLFVDGTQGGQAIITTGLQRVVSGAPFQLGSFRGCVDELAIYDKALAGARFAVHMGARTRDF